MKISGRCERLDCEAVIELEIPSRLRQDLAIAPYALWHHHRLWLGPYWTLANAAGTYLGIGEEWGDVFAKNS